MTITKTSLAILAAALLVVPVAAAEVDTPKGKITIPDQPQRIVVLNPALAGNIYALGLSLEAVVASTRAATDEGYSRFWADAARADGTTVIPWSFDAFDLEAIQSFQPDLIIGGGQGRPGFMTIEAYDKLALIAPTLIVDPALGTWQQQLDVLGGALQREAEEQAALDTYAARVAEVKAAIALPPQPTAFLLSLDAQYFLPEATATPALFAELGFEPDPLTERFPDLKPFGTGDSAEVVAELVPEVFSAPTIIVIPWDQDARGAEELAEDPIVSFLPAMQSGQAYDFPDYSYRFDYYTALAILDDIEATFAKAN